MEQLSAQARSDQVAIREHRDKIDSLHQQLETDKVGSGHNIGEILYFIDI